MLKIKSAVEYLAITIEHTGDQDIDQQEARRAADAWMQKKYGDLFMGGYVWDDEYFDSRGNYVVKYSR